MNCPHCGASVRAKLIPGTGIVAEIGVCPNDWCPNPERMERKRREALRTFLSMTMTFFFLLAMGFLAWNIPQWSEDAARRDCEERGGTFAPVRGVYNRPSGQGTCTEP